MVLLAGTLVRELAERRQELIDAAITTTSTTTTLIADALAEYFTEDVDNLNAWVYCPATSGPNAANTGLTRRASGYVATGRQLEFYVAWPVAPTPNGGTQDSYYVTTRTRWDRLRSALAAGVADIKIPYATPLLTDITIVANTYTYALSGAAGGIVPELVTDMGISVDTSSGVVGYPYAPGSPYNWTIYTTLNPTTGLPGYVLQFETLPSVGSTVRIWGRAPVQRFATDSALLLVQPQYEDAVREYLLMHAAFQLSRWDVDVEPVGKAQYALALSEATIQRAKAQLLDLLPRPPNARVVVPGRGTGRYLANPNGRDADYLAASHTTH